MHKVKILALFFMTLICCSFSAAAKDVTDFATATKDGKNFTINYEAFEKDTSLTAEQKAMVINALLLAPGHKSAASQLGGVQVNCVVQKKLGLPSGAACNLIITPDILKELVAFGAKREAAYLCAVLDEEAEFLTPICVLLLTPMIKQELNPLLTQCGNQNTTLSLDFEIVPPKVSPKGGCGVPPPLPHKVQCCTISKSNNCWSAVATCPPGHERNDGFKCTGDPYCGPPWGP